eukprot:Transcript_30026.p2 GENE.Transcript_30026~~Transcript_30026.p2  ORF type:complete len:108 (-),score=7.55 Transcript_30026:702-1025(-)
MRASRSSSSSSISRFAVPLIGLPSASQLMDMLRASLLVSLPGWLGVDDTAASAEQQRYFSASSASRGALAPQDRYEPSPSAAGCAGAGAGADGGRSLCSLSPFVVKM